MLGWSRRPSSLPSSIALYPPTLSASDLISNFDEVLVVHDMVDSFRLMCHCARMIISQRALAIVDAAWVVLAASLRDLFHVRALINLCDVQHDTELALLVLDQGPALDPALEHIANLWAL